jgi:hypothetical protein
MIQRLIPAGIRSDWLLVVRLDLHHRRLLDHRHGLRPHGRCFLLRTAEHDHDATGRNASHRLGAALLVQFFERQRGTHGGCLESGNEVMRALSVVATAIARELLAFRRNVIRGCGPLDEA